MKFTSALRSALNRVSNIANGWEMLCKYQIIEAKSFDFMFYVMWRL